MWKFLGRPVFKFCSRTVFKSLTGNAEEKLKNDKICKSVNSGKIEVYGLICNFESLEAK